MPVDRYALLDWLVQWDEDNPGLSLDGTALLMQASGLAGDDGLPWWAVARACGGLRRLKWIDWHYNPLPAEDREPLPQFIDPDALQRTRDIVVTAEGLKALAARKVVLGTQINIVNPTVGQLALGNISNVDMLVVLDAAEASLDAVDAPAEVKEESRRAIHRMRDVAQSVATTAAGETIAAALRHALGLP